jgi:hypothetical protein
MQKRKKRKFASPVLNVLRRNVLHAASQLLTAATSSLSTHNQMYYCIMNSYHSLSSTNTHGVHCTLSVGTVKGCCTVHFVLCSVSSISSSKQCCCVSELAKFEVLMKNTVWYGVKSQLCTAVLLVAAFVQLSLNIHPPLPARSL